MRHKSLLPWLCLAYMGLSWGLSFSMAKLAADTGAHPFVIAFLANQPLKPDFIWHLSYQRAQILYHAALNPNLSGPRPIGQCHPWRCLLLFRGKSARWGFIADRLVDTCPHLCNRLGDQKRNARGATPFGTNARL